MEDVAEDIDAAMINVEDSEVAMDEVTMEEVTNMTSTEEIPAEDFARKDAISVKNQDAG